MLSFNITGDEDYDLYRATIADMPWNQLPNIHLAQHDCPIMRYVFKEERVKYTDGTRWETRIEYGEDGYGRFAAFDTPRTAALNNVVTTIYAKIIHYDLAMTISEYERLQNKGDDVQIFNFLQQKMNSTMRRGFTEVENQAFKSPTDDDDNITPYGIPYLLPPATTTVRSAAITAGTPNLAFRGGVGFTPAGGSFTYKLGITPTTSAYGGRLCTLNGWWSNSSGEIGESDLETIRKVFQLLKWRSPVTKEESQTTMNNMFIGAPVTLLDALVRTAKAVNINNNARNIYGLVINESGIPVVMGNPVHEIEELNNEAAAAAKLNVSGYFPMYFLNLDHLFPIAQRGRFWFQRPLAKDDVNNPERFFQYWDLNYNYATDNFQRLGAIISYPYVA